MECGGGEGGGREEDVTGGVSWDGWSELFFTTGRRIKLGPEEGKEGGNGTTLGLCRTEQELINELAWYRCRGEASCAKISTSLFGGWWQLSLLENDKCTEL